MLEDSELMPADGVTLSKLRVELYESITPECAWIAEVNVLGELPWHGGESRQVKFRVMSESFREYVLLNKPDLMVRRGSAHIGVLYPET